MLTQTLGPSDAIVTRAEQLAREGLTVDAHEMLTSVRTLGGLTARERYDIGEALLRVSNCRSGWEEYNLHPSWAVDRMPGVQLWDGGNCRTLIISADLGFGDTILALRHVPALLRRVGQVVVAVHDVLFDLVRHSPALAGTTVVPKTQAQRTSWPTDARWERLFSLPAIVGTDAVRALPAYLCAPSAGPTVSKRADELIVGVAWRSTVRRGFPNRSIPSRLIARLAALPGLHLVCLHRDQDLRAIPRGVITVGVSNFVETAAVMGQCDLVVTADTVTAHLAPALGVPTLIGLRHWPAWIWGTKQNPTQWYQSAQLIFQDEDEEWSTVIDNCIAIVRRTAQQALTGRGES